jgi:hypothetical protein
MPPNLRSLPFLSLPSNSRRSFTSKMSSSTKRTLQELPLDRLSLQDSVLDISPTATVVEHPPAASRTRKIAIDRGLAVTVPPPLKFDVVAVAGIDRTPFPYNVTRRSPRAEMSIQADRRKRNKRPRGSSYPIFQYTAADVDLRPTQAWLPAGCPPKGTRFARLLVGIRRHLLGECGCLNAVLRPIILMHRSRCHLLLNGELNAKAK